MVYIFFFFVLTYLKFVTIELMPPKKEGTTFSALGGCHLLQTLDKFWSQYANFGNKKSCEEKRILD